MGSGIYSTNSNAAIYAAPIKQNVYDWFSCSQVISDMRGYYEGAVVLISNEVKLLSSAFYHHRAQSFLVLHKMLSSKHDVRIM